jgi:hypothetical protein
MVRMQPRKRNEGSRYLPKYPYLMYRRCPRPLLLDIPPQHRPPHRRHPLLPTHDPPTIHKKHNEHSPISTPLNKTHQHRPRPISTPHPPQRKTNYLPLCLISQSIPSSHIPQRQSLRKSVKSATGNVHGTKPFCTKFRSWSGETKSGFCTDNGDGGTVVVEFV